MREVPFFITTFSNRIVLLEGWLERYPTNAEAPVYVFMDDCDEARFLSNKYPNVEFVMDDLSIESKDSAGRTNLWSKRLISSIKYLQDAGYEYSIWSGDDMWIHELDQDRLSNAVEHCIRLGVDNYRLAQENKTGYTSTLADDVMQLANKYWHAYNSHQTSMWKLSSLLAISSPNYTSCDHEAHGSHSCINNRYLMCQFDRRGPIVKGLSVCNKGRYTGEYLPEDSKHLAGKPVW